MTTDEATQVTPEAHGLFVRKSSGLVREFRSTDVFVFNTLAYALGLVFSVVPTFAAGLWPAQNVLLIVTIGTLLTLFNAAMYGYLAATLPRSGGDYVYLSRIVHPALGFLASWGFTWSQFLGLAIYSAFTVSFGVAVSFATLGTVIGNDTLVSWSESVAKDWPTFGIGVGLLIVTLILISLPMRIVRRVFLVAFIPCMVGTIVTMFVMFTTSKQEFVGKFNAFMAEHGNGQTYQGLIDQASTAGFSAGDATFFGALLAIPLGYWIYIGFAYSNYIGGEVKQPSKTQPRMILLTLAFAYVVYMLIFWRYYDIVGKEFTNSVVYLDGNTSDGSGIPVAPVINLFAGLMTDSTVLNILMAISFILWNALGLPIIAMVCTRNLFAWAFDGIGPRQLAVVGKRTHIPWLAAIVIVAVATMLLAVFVFTSFFTIVANYIVMFSIAFWFVSFAAILLPYRRPEIFNQAPASVQRRIGGVPVISLFGVGNLILFTLILVASFKEPAFSGPTGGRAIAFIVGVYLSGPVIYFAAQAVRRRRGVDLGLLYREIPPE